MNGLMTALLVAGTGTGVFILAAGTWLSYRYTGWTLHERQIRFPADPDATDEVHIRPGRRITL